ncbi:MAG: EAL domain-containing protein, partial [Gammaproteobacteria bacterium]|nr:EAL domain-containing protein [Gammaproteobacteria bacterium]
LLYLIHLETGPEDEQYREQCMREASTRLQEVIDENDVLGRYSGNTFLLLSLFNKTRSPEVQAENLRRAIGDLDGLLPGVTRSRVSAVIVDKYCKDGEHAIARLKDTFIQAQEADQPVRIDVAQFIHMPGSQTMDHVWARRVSTILKNNRLTLSSLPIYSLRHDALERFSLRLNLTDDTGENIPLSQFQDTVIQTGLASNVDRWIIFNAARQLVDKLRDTPHTQFFIPLVGNVMLEDDLYPWIEKIIDQFKLPTNSLVLETSVDSALTFPDAFSHFCRKMRDIHCGVYLTGLDDPTITHELFDDGKNHIDYLAVDKNLLDGLQGDPEKHETIEILVQQCHRQKTLTVVTDPVEPEVLSELWKLGIDLMINANLTDQPDEVMELDLTATLSA